MSFKAIGEGGRELRLSFSHGRRIVKEGKNKGLEKRFVEAHVLTPTPGQTVLKDGFEHPVLTLLGLGVASCSFLDSFDSEEGRKIAMNRAIEDALRVRKVEGNLDLTPNITRAEAGALKKAYFTRKKRRGGQGKPPSSGEGGGMTFEERRKLKVQLKKQERPAAKRRQLTHSGLRLPAGRGIPTGEVVQ